MESKFNRRRLGRSGRPAKRIRKTAYLTLESLEERTVLNGSGTSQAYLALLSNSAFPAETTSGGTSSSGGTSTSGSGGTSTSGSGGTSTSGSRGTSTNRRRRHHHRRPPHH